MGFSDPWYKYLDIIAFQSVKNLGINPMGISVPWTNSLDIIDFQKAKRNI